MKIDSKTIDGEFIMPIFGAGTWMLGGDKNRDPGNDGKSDIQALERAIKQGITHIDTAEIYAEGFAEDIVHCAIKDKDRSSLFLVSKVSSENLRYDDVKAALQRTLNRLGTDYLDLYLIHAPNPEIPLKETVAALDSLKDEGLINNIGVSNFSVPRMQEAQDLSKYRIVATQVHYNLIFREPEVKGVIQHCLQNKVMVIAWRPLQKGMLCNKGEVPLLDSMCAKYDKSPAQIAINWLISQPGIVTLSTMRDKNHLLENLGALGWEMDTEDIEILRNAFPHRKNESDAVPLR